MSVEITLFVLRVAAALVLLGFLGMLAWFMYRDMQAATGELAASRDLGSLQVVAIGAQNPEGVGVGQRFPLLPVTSLGRAVGNTIVLRDAYVSNEHALLTLRGAQWWLEDLNSRNGTLLNGIQVSDPTIVGAGDVIGIGEIELKLQPVGAGTIDAPTRETETATATA